MFTRKAYEFGWDGKERYIRKIKKMEFPELKEELFELKGHLSTLNLREMEHKVIDRRTLVALKISAINVHLESLL